MPSHVLVPLPGAGAGAAPPEAHAEALGFLTFDSFPWTRVSEGSRVLGTTPLVRVALAPGVHMLTLENPEQHLAHSLSVTIKANETTVKRLALK